MTALFIIDCGWLAFLIIIVRVHFVRSFVCDCLHFVHVLSTKYVSRVVPQLGRFSRDSHCRCHSFIPLKTTHTHLTQRPLHCNIIITIANYIIHTYYHEPSSNRNNKPSPPLTSPRAKILQCFRYQFTIT